MIDDILKKYDVDFDELRNDEKETLYSWVDALEKNQITVQKIKEFVAGLREAIEQELVKEPEFTYIFIFKVPNRNQIYLKARLRNIMLFEAFLAGPEKARKAIEAQIASLKPRT